MKTLNKIISLDSLQRLVVIPLKRLIDRKAETWHELKDKPNVLLYDEQILTEEQKNQVKHNLGIVTHLSQNDDAQDDRIKALEEKTAQLEEELINAKILMGLDV